MLFFLFLFLVFLMVEVSYFFSLFFLFSLKGECRQMGKETVMSVGLMQVCCRVGLFSNRLMKKNRVKKKKRNKDKSHWKVILYDAVKSMEFFFFLFFCFLIFLESMFQFYLVTNMGFCMASIWRNGVNRKEGRTACTHIITGIHQYPSRITLQ